MADAVAAVTAATAAAARRWAGQRVSVSPGELASSVSAGLLLAPGFTPEWTNTSSSWTASCRRRQGGREQDQLPLIPGGVMSPADDDDDRVQRACAVALFRYALIREAADPALSTRQRGRLVRELAAREHAGPFGTPVAVSRASLDRWIRAWRSGGFDALAPPARQVTPRTPAEMLELAAALKRENPGRTAAQVARILRASDGWSPSERTLQRHFASLELTTRQRSRCPLHLYGD